VAGIKNQKTSRDKQSQQKIAGIKNQKTSRDKQSQQKINNQKLEVLKSIFICLFKSKSTIVFPFFFCRGGVSCKIITDFKLPENSPKYIPSPNNQDFVRNLINSSFDC